MYFNTYKFLSALLVFLSFTPNFSHASNEFQSWLKQEQQQFHDYRDKRDKEFFQYLKSQWREMKVYQGLSRDNTPKPDSIPVADTSIKPSKPVVIHKPPVQPTSLPLTDSDIVTTDTTSIDKIKSPLSTNGEVVDLSFYGHKLTFNYDPLIIHTLKHSVDNLSISNAWSKISKADYDSLSNQLQTHRNLLNLNDWGYALLIYNLSKKLHDDINNQSIFTWFFLTKSGYKTRIAYDRNRVYLLLATKQTLFSTPYFVYDNTRFYAVSFTQDNIINLTNIYTYNGSYPEAINLLDMNVSYSFLSNKTKATRNLIFHSNNKVYNIHVGINKELINYLNTYPQLDISMYFHTDLDTTTTGYLLTQLKPLLKDKSELDAINLLLDFVQSAFSYQSDRQQFGTENYLLPQETLYYPYSDCEDRSVLFAWLVRKLLGLEVIGLDYPGHISVAVKLNENISGDTILYNGNKYIITDPTFTNARAGVSMPQYKNITPEIILIKQYLTQ